MEAVNQEPPTIRPEQPKMWLIVLAVLSFLFAFGGGYVLSTLLHQEKISVLIPTSTPTPSPSPAPITVLPPEENPRDIPGGTLLSGQKKYFDDTVFVVEKAAPHRTLIASVTRIEGDQNYSQNTRASYFDGTNWVREVGGQNTNADQTIGENTIIKKWDVVADPSRVLQEKMTGEIQVKSKPVTFRSDTLYNEIGMRSEPEYTKFMSEGTGTARFEGVEVPVHIFYTKIYSMDMSKIQFYSQPIGLTTDWVAFWDNNGNFYHVDTTKVNKPTPIYQAHQIGVFKDLNDAITKTFQVEVSRDQDISPTLATINLNKPIYKKLQLTRTSVIDKSITNKYYWYMNAVEGTVLNENGEEIPGFGFYEYIHDLD